MEKKKEIKNISEVTVISLQLPTDLLEAYTKLAKKVGIPRSSQMVIALRNYLEQNEIMSNLPELIDMFQEYKKEKYSKKH